MTDSIDKSISAHERGEHLFCAYCGTEDKTDYGYCDHCGERVAAPDSVRFSSRELGKCQTCSADNQLHARHCVGCGVSFEDTPLVQNGRGPTDPSLRDAAYPDPPEPDGSHSPSRVSTAEPKERQDDHRAPPYARPERPPSRQERRLDSWSSSDARGADNGPSADEFDGREYDPAARQDEGEANDSGTREGQLPTELRGYNWGALLLGPIWGVGNRTWVATVLFAIWFIPIPAIGLPLYVFGALYLGSHANRWAWRSKKWMSIEHFRRTQQNWVFWGFIVSPVIVFSLIVPLWASGS
ncbi:MAG: hypothetical protein IH868_03640 [Chloroflexi bacterium]|nr:hypothetical protein [Chloroflexota bacterium]